MDRPCAEGLSAHRSSLGSVHVGPVERAHPGSHTSRTTGASQAELTATSCRARPPVPRIGAIIRRMRRRWKRLGLVAWRTDVSRLVTRARPSRRGTRPRRQLVHAVARSDAPGVKPDRAGCMVPASEQGAGTAAIERGQTGLTQLDQLQHNTRDASNAEVSRRHIIHCLVLFPYLPCRLLLAFLPLLLFFTLVNPPSVSPLPLPSCRPYAGSFRLCNRSSPVRLISLPLSCCRRRVIDLMQTIEGANHQHSTTAESSSGYRPRRKTETKWTRWLRFLPQNPNSVLTTSIP